MATEAVRRADNGAEFLEAAQQATGQPITVLSGHDEAHTAAMGIAYSFHAPHGVVGDLGGGSVDLSVVTPDGPTAPYGSLPIGTLPVTRMMLEDSSAAARLIDARLATLPWLAGAARDRSFYVVGGGWRALARIRLAMTDTPLKVVHDYRLNAEEAMKLGRSIAGLDADELRTVPGMPGRRIETVKRGGPAARARGAHDRAPIGRVLGLRPARGPGVPAAAGRRAGRGPAAGGCPRFFGRSRSRLPEIGQAMGEWTAAVAAGETSDQRRVRLAVCEVSDSAWREHPAFRAREAFYRLAQYPFIGLDHAQRAFLAYAVFIRYEGSPDDLFTSPIRSLLPQAEQRRAELLGAALQLGYRISAAVPDLLQSSRLELAGDEGQLRLPGARRGAGPRTS